MRALEQLPHRGAIAPESGPVLEVRHLLYRGYRILFTIGPDAVHIRHSARQQLISAAPEENGEDDG